MEEKQKHIYRPKFVVATQRCTNGHQASIGKKNEIKKFGYLSVRLLWAVVVAAIIIHHDLPVLVVQARGWNQFPAAAVLRQGVPAQDSGAATEQTGINTMKKWATKADGKTARAAEKLEGGWLSGAMRPG